MRFRRPNPGALAARIGSVAQRFRQAARRGVASVRQWLRAGLDFLYVPQCLLCEQELERPLAATAANLCPICRDDLLQDAGRACRSCGAPVGPHLDLSSCPQCRRNRFAFDRVLRLGIYDKLLRLACLRGKKRGAEGLLVSLAELTWERIAAELQEIEIDVVVPVPHHWSQKLLRPHNPAEVLARCWSKLLGVECAPHLLRKVRRTRSQARLNANERRHNLRNAFAATVDLTDATVLLVDDVLTTGTTAHEAARMLKQAGAREVVVVVLGRGIGRR